MRTVILSARAAATLDAAYLQYPMLEEAYRGLEWRICRDIGAGKALPKDSNAQAYIIRWRELGTTPSLMLVYRLIDDGRIEVVSARTKPSLNVVGGAL
jgi:hypothetical protein